MGELSPPLSHSGCPSLWAGLLSKLSQMCLCICSQQLRCAPPLWIYRSLNYPGTEKTTTKIFPILKQFVQVYWWLTRGTSSKSHTKSKNMCIMSVHWTVRRRAHCNVNCGNHALMVYKVPELHLWAPAVGKQAKSADQTIYYINWLPVVFTASACTCPSPRCHYLCLIVLKTPELSLLWIVLWLLIHSV